MPKNIAIIINRKSDVFDTKKCANEMHQDIENTDNQNPDVKASLMTSILTKKTKERLITRRIIKNEE